MGYETWGAKSSRILQSNPCVIIITGYRRTINWISKMPQASDSSAAFLCGLYFVSTLFLCFCVCFIGFYIYFCCFHILSLLFFVDGSLSLCFVTFPLVYIICCSSLQFPSVHEVHTSSWSGISILSTVRS